MASLYAAQSSRNCFKPCSCNTGSSAASKAKAYGYLSMWAIMLLARSVSKHATNRQADAASESSDTTSSQVSEYFAKEALSKATVKPARHKPRKSRRALSASFSGASQPHELWAT
jgi:hypothetical protein